VHLTGVLAWRRGDAAEAMEALRRASELLGDAAAAGEVLRDLCEMLRVGGRIDEAARAGKRAVRLRPHDANAHYNLGIVLQELGDLDGSIAALRAAVALAPRHAGAHFELAEALLLRGDFADGWEEYEWRFDVAGAAPLMPNTPAAPKWTGEPMPDGRLLLVADQGYGDVIQFMRYVPEAEARCGAVVIACSSETATLVRQVAKTTELFQVWDDAPRFDCYAALSSLPRLFGTRLETVPSTGRYLVAEPARAACWRERLKALTPARFRTIGLVWAGRPTHGNDANRSMPLAVLAGRARAHGARRPAEGRGGRPGWAVLRRGAADQPWAGDPRLFRHGGHHRQSRPGRERRHLRRPSCGRARAADFSALAVRARLAVAARAQRQPVVSQPAPLPAEPTRRLDRSRSPPGR
jgi:hypothetical protein